MNKAGSCSAASKENRKRPAIAGLFLRLSWLTSLFRRRQRQRLDFGRSRHDRRLLLALVEDQLVALHGDFAALRHRRAGARRNQPADNDVLLEAFERIDLA